HRGPRQHGRRLAVPHVGRRAPTWGSDVSGRHRGDVQGWIEGARAVERPRPLETVRVRPAAASDHGGRRSRARAAARRQQDQQLSVARAGRRQGGHEVGHEVDSVARGPSAVVGVLRMRSAAGALRDGMGRVNRAPAVLAGVWLLTLAVSAPLALGMRALVEQHLGDSLAAQGALDSVDYTWWQEFTDQAAGLGVTFRPTIIGFGAVLDNLSAFLDNQHRPVVIVGAATAYIVFWIFLAGGIIDRYARDRATRAHGFFAV